MGEGMCEEGLADLQPIWTTQSSLEQRAGYLLVQARPCLPPEAHPVLQVADIYALLMLM